jgi:hypothetical protein
MKLVRADGHRPQQWALANAHAQTIARILSEHLDDDATLLREVATVLRRYTGEVYRETGLDGLNQQLTHISNFYDLAPNYISQLLEALRNLYCHPLDRLFGSLDEQINSLRGAIVELLGLALVRPRYDLASDECANSRRFFDQENVKITLQEVDIAAISYVHRQLECYECKLKVLNFNNADRIDLEYVYNTAGQENYTANVGVISFDARRIIIRRLNYLDAADYIQAYGLDTLSELHSPFDI